MIEVSKLKMAKEAALSLNLFEKTAYDAYGVYPQEAYTQGISPNATPNKPISIPTLLTGLGGLGIAGAGAYSLLKSPAAALTQSPRLSGAGLEAALATLLAGGASYGIGKYLVGNTKAQAPVPSAGTSASKATGSGGRGKPPTKATNSASSSTALHKIKRLQEQGVIPEVYKLSPASRNVTNTGAGGGSKPPTKATNSASSSTALHKIKRLQQQGVMPEVYKLSPASRNVTNTGAGGGGKPPTKATNLERLRQLGILPERHNLSPALNPKGKHFGVKKPSVSVVQAVRSLLDKLKRAPRSTII